MPTPVTLSRGLVLIGAIGLLIGALLPWVSLTFGPVTPSTSGTDGGDGWWFIGGAGAVALPRATSPSPASASSATDQVFGVQYGAGLWVLAVAVAAVLAGGVSAGRRRRR